jgi:hypothetical protein
MSSDLRERPLAQLPPVIRELARLLAVEASLSEAEYLDQLRQKEER